MQLRELFDEIPNADSGVIPLVLQQLLREDLNVSNDWQKAEHLLLRAKSALPEQLEIYVALYKLYAYSNRFDESLAVIEEVLCLAAAKAGINNDWRELSNKSTVWHGASGALRIYLYSLKATGFVRLRRGDVGLAVAVLQKLQELDPLDQVGGSVVHEMAERMFNAD